MHRLRHSKCPTFQGSIEMKTKCTLIIVAVLLICLAHNPAYALKMADFEISDSSITVGDRFDVAVSVYDDGTLADLTGFGFDIRLDQTTSVLGYTGYTMGPDFLDAPDPFNPDFVGGLYIGFGNAGQSVELATLSFQALQAGTGTIDIFGMFDDMFYGLFYSVGYDDIIGGLGDESIQGNVDVTVNAAPVPEPSTIILMLTGLAGVVGFKKRRNQ